jgi:uncharacterized protein (TIGR02466 family)
MHFDISNFKVYPVFPSAIGIVVIQEDLSRLTQIENFEYFTGPGCHNLWVTQNQQLFSNFLAEKNIVMSYFNKFKNDVLKLETTDFAITTSWATKTLNNGFGDVHSHKNSYYSAVLYFDNCQDGGEIEFENVGLKPDSFLLNYPTESNIFNSKEFCVSPKRNKIVFFPSYLRHRTKTYLGTIPRYSIAINFIPVGTYGLNDSLVNVSYIPPG